jgi:peptidyl-prolyl cis-trans isomerase B (cyclophilin B)
VRRALPIALVALAAGCGGDDDGDQPAAADRPAAERAAGTEGQAPRQKPDGGERAPKERLPAGERVDVVVSTNCGDFTIRLDQRTSPRTAASFAALAEKGFYDGTSFHRIVPGFVIQGGDPTGSGAGGPGYSTRDVPPSDTTYTKGVVAMAKTAQEPPGTAGSQFYVVTAPDAGLPPEYAVLGEVVKGMDTVERIGRLGDAASGGAGTPTQAVVIESAEVRRG